MKAYGVGGQPLYLKIYDYYKAMIVDGHLSPGSRLPSIRACSQQLQVSKTTAQAAYFQLAADGYLISRPQSGYYVTDLYADRTAPQPDRQKKKSAVILYDFSSMSVDAQSFDFALWSRYIKSALRQKDRLLSYGEPAGEQDLRQALSQYVQQQRGAVCSPNQIVVGAGVQSLLHVLCPILPTHCSVCFPDNAFPQGQIILADHALRLTESDQAQLLYVMPSRLSRWNSAMPVQQRLALLSRARQLNQWILEDDYDQEFRYFSRPTPCLQGLAGGENVIYIGTFSRLLLPSLRLSFMILPPSLLDAYEKTGDQYNQTVSKTEQIALCQFIRDGHLQSQLRRLRRLYRKKAELLSDEIHRQFGEHATIQISDNGLYLRLELPDLACCSQVLAEHAALHGVAVRPIAGDAPALLLSCTAVPAECFADAIARLKDACTPN